MEGSEFAVSCSSVIGAIWQSVDTTLAEREGLRVTGWGIAADERTLAAETYEGLGRADEAARLRDEAAVLRDYVSTWNA